MERLMSENIHLYYLTRINSLNDLIYDTGQWTLGDIGTYGFNVSPSTDICAQMRNKMILVYAQLEGNTIQEYTYNGQFNASNCTVVSYRNTKIASRV